MATVFWMENYTPTMKGNWTSTTKWTRESLFKFSKHDISIRWNDYFEKLDANHSCIFFVIVTSILSAQNYINSDQIIRSMKVYTDFLTVFLSTYSQENFQKSVQPTAPKFSQNFWKNWWVQNFLLFVRKFISNQIFLERTKPRA